MNIEKNSYIMRVFLVFICFGLMSCQAFLNNKAESTPGVTNLKQERETDSVVSKEEFMIYSYLLNNNNSLSGNRVFIADKTISGLVKPYSNLKEVLNDIINVKQYTLPEDLSDDYISKNEKSVEFNDNFDLKHDYKVGEASEFSSDSFAVICGFSRVGFNKQKNLALVYFEYSAGPKNAGGTFVILTKVDGEWVVLKKYTSWVS